MCLTKVANTVGTRETLREYPRIGSTGDVDEDDEGLRPEGFCASDKTFMGRSNYGFSHRSCPDPKERVLATFDGGCHPPDASDIMACKLRTNSTIDRAKYPMRGVHTISVS